MAQFDPRDILNNFCFHVYAQKSLIRSEIGNVYFLTAAREFGCHRAGSQLKILMLLIDYKDKDFAQGHSL